VQARISTSIFFSLLFSFIAYLLTMNPQQKTRCFSDLVYEVILLSPIWGIALVYGWKEISKFLETL
jgi:hypothetical protein